MPALPFSKNDNVQPLQRKFRRERSPAKKFQRRYSPLDANMVQEMVNKLTSEKQSELHLMRMASTSINSFVDVEQNQTGEEQHHQGFRRDYSIGEIIRSSSHMIIPQTSEQAIQSTSTLNKHDYAFIKRSDGSYSYAILAYRSMEPIKGTNNSEECMVFVLEAVAVTLFEHASSLPMEGRCTNLLQLCLRTILVEPISLMTKTMHSSLLFVPLIGSIER